MNTGKFATMLGNAHEFIVIGVLLQLGLEVGKVDASASAYDLFVYAFKEFDYEKDNPDTKTHADRIFLRTQIKTVNGALSIGGGSRGGIDRTYKTDVKTYRYTTEHNDLVIGVDRNNLDFYILPTSLASKHFKKSIGTHRLAFFKNNYDILFNWEHDWSAEYLKSLRA